MVRTNGAERSDFCSIFLVAISKCRQWSDLRKIVGIGTGECMVVRILLLLLMKVFKSP